MCKHNEAWQSLLCYYLTIIILIFLMEKIWNKTKPVTKKLLSLSSDINVVHSCMMYKIIIISDLMYVKNKLT